MLRSVSTVSAALVASSSATRMFIALVEENPGNYLTVYSVEHQDIDIVSVNDPFIEPEYAVSRLSSPYNSKT